MLAIRVQNPGSIGQLIVEIGPPRQQLLTSIMKQNKFYFIARSLSRKQYFGSRSQPYREVSGGATAS